MNNRPTTKRTTTNTAKRQEKNNRPITTDKEFDNRPTAKPDKLSTDNDKK